MNNCLSVGFTILGAIFLGIFITVAIDTRIRSETKSNREYQKELVEQNCYLKHENDRLKDALHD